MRSIINRIKDYYRNIKETKYLNSILGMSESIIECHNEKIEDCIVEDEVKF